MNQRNINRNCEEDPLQGKMIKSLMHGQADLSAGCDEDCNEATI